MANNPWFRLWGDMVNDPKWRTIARVSGQSIGDVISTYLHMMTLASNAAERGRTQGFKDEDVATALDLQSDQITAIRAAMQGRVIDGDYLTGWEKRQPLREDGSAERSKQHREMEKLKNEIVALKNELTKTQPNATERDRTQPNAREEKIREEKKEHRNPLGAAAPADGGQGNPDALPDCPGDLFGNPQSGRPGAKANSADAEFEEAFAAYPTRHGSNPKADARSAWRARRAEGEAAAVLLAGVQRYAAWAHLERKVGTEFVMRACRFFGKNREYLQPWSPRTQPVPAAGDKFQLAGVDRSADRAAMNATLQRLQIAQPEGEIKFT